MFRKWIPFALTAILVLAASGTLAQGPVAAGSQAWIVSPDPVVSMFMWPDGSGTPLLNCYRFGGAMTSCTIVVQLMDAAGGIVTGWPQSSIRLEQGGATLAWCADAWYPPPPHAPNLADGPSNAAGQTTFTRSYHGGGWNLSAQVWLLEADGVWRPIPVNLPVQFNSPDINGDLAVNLTDISLFATDYFGPYQYRSDFYWDGAVNLSDVSLLAQSVGVTCP